MEDNALRLSATLAYYSILSVALLLVIAIGVAGLVVGEAKALTAIISRSREFVSAM